MPLQPLTNRAAESGAYTLPADGYYPLVPLGECPAKAGGRRVVQVLDAPALQTIANRVEADLAANPGGLLIDYDHSSLDLNKPTRAAGWLVAVANRADGLYAHIRWSKTGQEDIEGGAYRYLSPVFDGDDLDDLGNGRVRPRRLLNAGLTNDPNLKTLRPLTNRSQTKETPAVNEAILKSLGLPADAAEDKVAEAITALRNRADTAPTLQAELDTLKKEKLEAQVDADLETHKAVIANRDEVKKQLIANRDATLAVLVSLKPAEAKTIPNRRDGTIPAADPAADETGDDRRKAGAIRNRAAEIQTTQRVTYSQAWELARQEIA